MSQKKPTHKLFFWLFIRVFSVLTLTIVAFFALVFSPPLQTILQKSSHESFAQRASSKAAAVSQNLRRRWSNLDSVASDLNTTLADTLHENNANISDIADNPHLNQTILANMYSPLVNLIRQMNVNDAYIILNGPGRENEPAKTARAALYLRTNAPNNYYPKNSDLLLRIGAPAISRTYNLALDSYWQSCFVPSLCADTDFFDQPYNAYLHSQGTANAAPSDWGYWCMGRKLYKHDAANLMTYSVPLYNASGTLWGILGIGFLQQNLENVLPAADLGDGGGAWLLAHESHSSMRTIWAFGDPAYTVYLGNSSLSLTAQEHLATSTVDKVQGITEDLAAVSVPLQLYANNTPYADNQLYLIAVTPLSILNRAAIQITTLLCILGHVIWLACILGTTLIAWVTTRPITDLSKEVRAMAPQKPMHLTRTGIEEIDVLSQAVEQKNREAVEEASRFSEIAEMTGELFGAFEVEKASGKVFITGDMVHLLGLEPSQHWVEMPQNLFDRRMEILMRDQLNKDEPIYRLINEDGSCQWIKLSVRTGEYSIRGVITNVTDQVDRRLKMDYEHTYDVLTDLMNNRAFQERLNQLFVGKKSLGLGLMIMWDLDDLKSINDSHGHESGDGYIHSFANWLKTISGAGPIGFSARRSGDEFFTFLCGFDSVEKRKAFLLEMSRHLHDMTDELYSGTVVKLSASAGAARFPEDADTPTELMRCADAAMYAAKREGKGMIELFDATRDRRQSVYLTDLEKLNRLIEQRMVRFAYQPIVRLRDARIMGYEMLLRPQGDDFSNPQEVLSAAKSLGMLYQMEHLTLFGAIEQAIRDLESGVLAPGRRLLMNSIANECLSDEDCAKLCDLALPVLDHQVTLEVTEGEPMNAELTARKRALLHHLHGRFALDDYGTGYNGRTTLLTLYPEIIKMDRSLVRNLDTDTYKQEFLRNLVAFAAERSMMVLAEGVETVDELRAAIRLGADLAQGYVLARPAFTPPELPDEITAVILENR